MQINTNIYDSEKLLIAAKDGNLDVVKNLTKFRLLGRLSDVNFKDGDGWTPLMHASRNGYLDIVENLIRSGADVNAKDSYGFTALLLAINKTLNRSNLFKIVEALIKAGADVNSLCDIGDYTDRDYINPLYKALEINDISIIKSLVRAGADINHQYYWGSTVLMFATRENNLKLVEILIELGANVSIKNNFGNKAVDFTESKEIIEKLKKSDPLYSYLVLRSLIEKSPIYRNWKKEVFKKYGKICQICGTKDNLEIHHRQSMYSILKNNNVDSVYKAIDCKELWDVENGIVLCSKCHKEMESSKKYNELNQ
jgi:hypothetical protein